MVQQDTIDSDTQDMQIPQEVRVFLQGLLLDAGMNDLDPIMQESMETELYIRLDKFLIGKIVEYLPQEKIDGFTTFLEQQPTREMMQEYLTNNLPNAQDVFTVAFAEFRTLYLSGVGHTQQKLIDLGQAEA